MSDLLSCPFCGGEAVGFEWSDDDYRDDETEPHDTDAYCAVKVNHKENCILEVGEFYMWIATTEAEAAELWNTRVERTCHAVFDDSNWYKWICSECGQPIDRADNYCFSCGAKVTPTPL